MGAKECNECQKLEYKVWQQTVHYKSYREVHRKPEAKKILKAVGAKSMKRDVACYLCHYSRDQKDAQDSPRVSSGPSCESCHSPASEWITIHNDYGGKDVKREQESPEHKAKRFKFIEEKGPLWHHQVYKLAANCMQCHGLANPELDSDLLGKMLDADHPIEPDFEFIRYSQGSVRHRYYPYGSEVNQPLSKAELARLFIIGQAAKLISATQASTKSKHPRYTKAQKERADQAKQALNRVKDIAAVKTLLVTPTESNAINLSEAIEKMDLSAKVSDLLPNEKDYK